MTLKINKTIKQTEDLLQRWQLGERGVSHRDSLQNSSSGRKGCMWELRRSYIQFTGKKITIILKRLFYYGYFPELLSDPDSWTVDKGIRQGCDQTVQHSHNDILLISVIEWGEKVECNNCSIAQRNSTEMRATCGQGFADCLDGGGSQDGGPVRP
jgi:hypothetical protein